MEYTSRCLDVRRIDITKMKNKFHTTKFLLNYFQSFFQYKKGAVTLPYVLFIIKPTINTPKAFEFFSLADDMFYNNLK